MKNSNIIIVFYRNPSQKIRKGEKAMMGTNNEKTLRGASTMTFTLTCALVAFVTIYLTACGEKVTSISIDVGDPICGVDCPDDNGDGICDDDGTPCQNPGGDGDGDVDVENCGNGRDDDGDGNVDCNDSDCFGSPACQNDPCDGDPDCEDRDGDTWTTGDGDCNDHDRTVYPGAEEVCDGQDNDCDGAVDEGGCCGEDAQCTLSAMQCSEWPEPDGSLVEFGYAPGGEDSAVLLNNGCYLFPSSNCVDFRAQYGGPDRSLQAAIHSAFNIDPSLTAVSCAEVCW